MIELLLTFTFLRLNLQDFSAQIPSINFFYVVLAAVLVYFFIFKNRDRARPRSFYSFKFLFIFCIYMQFVSLYHYFGTGHAPALQYSGLMTFLVVASYFLSRNLVSLDKIFLFTFRLLILFLVLSILASLVGGSIRMRPIGGNSATTAGVAGVYLIFIAKYLRFSGLITSVVYYSSVCVGIFSLIYAFSRSAWLSFLVVILSLWLLKFFEGWRGRSSRSNVGILIMASLIGMVSVWLVSYADPVALQRLVARLTVAEEFSEGRSNRLLHFYYFKYLMSGDPINWFVGIGFENYRYSGSDIFSNVKASGVAIHNAYLQYIIACGIPGLLLFLIYLGHLIVGTIKIERKDRRDLILALILVQVVVALFQPLILSKFLLFFVPIFVHISRNNIGNPRSHFVTSSLARRGSNPGAFKRQ